MRQLRNSSNADNPINQFHCDTLLERHDPVTQGSNARVCTAFGMFKKRFSRVLEHLLEITAGVLLLYWMTVVRDTVEE